LEERFVRQPDDDMVRVFALGILAHASLGQLGEPDAEIDVGPRVVRVPTALLAPVAREHAAAEVEGALEGRRRREFGWRVAVVPGKDLLGVAYPHTDGKDANEDRYRPRHTLEGHDAHSTP